MSLDSIYMTAATEAEKQVSWKNNKARVQEYIRLSTNSAPPDKPDRSWCGDFAYWVLFMAGVSPLPPVAVAAKGGWTTISRFKATYGSYKPADYLGTTAHMYYMPQVRGIDGQLHTTHHVGFVMSDDGSGMFDTLDGNGMGGGNYGIMTPNTIGGGYVSYARRERALIEYFIELPD